MSTASPSGRHSCEHWRATADCDRPLHARSDSPCLSRAIHAASLSLLCLPRGRRDGLIKDVPMRAAQRDLPASREREACITRAKREYITHLVEIHGRRAMHSHEAVVETRENAGEALTNKVLGCSGEDVNIVPFGQDALHVPTGEKHGSAARSYCKHATVD